VSPYFIKIPLITKKIAVIVRVDIMNGMPGNVEKRTANLKGKVGTGLWLDVGFWQFAFSTSVLIF
jgi:hypothetical protein